VRNPANPPTGSDERVSKPSETRTRGPVVSAPPVVVFAPPVLSGPVLLAHQDSSDSSREDSVDRYADRVVDLGSGEGWWVV